MTTPTTYSGSAEGIIISRERAIQELAAHGLAHYRDVRDFDADLGCHDTYRASDVLTWLGY